MAQIPEMTASAGKNGVGFHSFCYKAAMVAVGSHCFIYWQPKQRAQIEVVHFCPCILSVACEKKQVLGSELLAVLYLQCG